MTSARDFAKGVNPVYALAVALEAAQEAHHGQPAGGWAAWYAGWLHTNHPELFAAHPARGAD